MSKEKDIEERLILLFDDIKDTDNIKVAIGNIFSSYISLLDSFKESFNRKYEDDVKYALRVNKNYYETVQTETEKYKKILDNNTSSLKDAIKSNDDKLIKIQNKNDELKAEAKIIADNREIDVKKEIIIANKKLAQLIRASDKEIEVIKKTYLENSDKLLRQRDIELEILANEYQIKLEQLRQETRDRNQIYEIQISKNRQIREQYVNNHSEKYREIKNLHNSFSIYYNTKIDEISQKYRNKVKELNEIYNEKVNIITEKISELEKNILSKEIETKDLIQNKSESLMAPFQEAKDNYDKALRELLQKQNSEINRIQSEFNKFELETNNKINSHRKNYESGEKSNEDRKILNNLIKPLRKSIINERKVAQLKIKSIKSDYKTASKNLYDLFSLKKINLDIEFISFEYEASIENAKYFEETLLEINLLSLEIEKLEEEKNQKIWSLNNAYNYDIAYIERILALGSERQEFMIQDQVGNNSFALAASQFNNEVVKTSFEIDCENINLEIKILKIIYLNNVKKITSKYQLLIQEEMVKRDTLIKQYEYEIEIERENLKQVELNANLDYDLLRLKTEYDLDVALTKNEQHADKLNYFLNLTKIKLDDLNKRNQATLEYENAQAKAQRNMIMNQLESEKADRYYLGLIETLFRHHLKLDEISKIIEKSYLHPEFSMTKFYHLIDYIVELLPQIQDESKLIVSYFSELTDEEISNKIDQLTGFHYQNRLQSLLDQKDSSEEIIKQDIDQLTEDRRKLNNELMSIDHFAHRDNIRISQLYRDIRVLKTDSNDIESSDELIRLKAELETLNNQVKQAAKLKKIIEKQISFKDNQILKLNNRISRLNRTYGFKKKKLNNQVKREGRVYYKEKENNLNAFDDLNNTIDKYIQGLLRNLNELKLNLSKTLDAVNIYSNKTEILSQTFKNELFSSLQAFRKVNLKMYFNQEKDQENISSSFDSSYNILVFNLKQNYRNNFLKEKRKNNERKRNYELALLKLQQQYDLNVLKTQATFDSRTNAINKQLENFDKEFSNTFIYRQDYIKIIDVNRNELNRGLEQNTIDLRDTYTSEFKAYESKKKTLLKDLSTNNLRLFNSTVARSIKYRDNYLETKKDIEETLKDYERENRELIKHKKIQYRKYLKNKKLQEKREYKTYKTKLKLKNKRINQRYLQNLRKNKAQQQKR